MKIEGNVLVKGHSETVGKLDGKIFRNVLFFGVDGLPADIKASCNDDNSLWEKSKKVIYQKCKVIMELVVYNGIPSFRLVSLEPVVNKPM